MEQQFDPQTLMTQANAAFQKIRKSEAYPALIGGIAGGIAGALFAALIARQVIARAKPPASESAPAPAQAPRATTARLKISDGLTMREVMQLITIGASLAKQAQGLYQARKPGK